MDEKLDIMNMKRVESQFKATNNLNKIVAIFTLSRNNNDMSMMLGFSNSYDKSMTVKIGMGAVVQICTNGAINAENIFKRKHTGNVLKDLASFIDNDLDKLEDNFLQIEDDFNRFKSIELTKRTMAELSGRLFIEERILTPTQMSIVKKEITNSSYPEFREDNLYNFYQHITHSMKSTHPSNMTTNLNKIHKFIKNEYK